MRASRSLFPLACVVALGLGASAAYTVRPGDTLSSIAQRLRVSVQDLADANKLLDLDKIAAGQSLNVPGGPPNVQVHVVVPGDTLTTIAARYGTNIAVLTDANHLSPQALLRPGAKLLVPVPTVDRAALVPLFHRWADANHLPVDLLMATTWLESGWQANVVSSTGAYGIGQLMPGTAAFVRDALIGDHTLDVRNPEQNIRMSARYLSWLVDRANGDTDRALAGYYQGPHAVDLFGLLPETHDYVRGVQALRRQFHDGRFPRPA